MYLGIPEENICDSSLGLSGLFSLEFGFYYSIPVYCGVDICLSSQRRNLLLHEILPVAACSQCSMQVVLIEPTQRRQTLETVSSKFSDEKVIKNMRLICLEDRFQLSYNTRE